MTINELIAKAHGAAKAKGFWDKERNTSELLMLIVSECGEALEAHRKGKVMAITPIQPTGIPMSRDQATWKQCVEHEDYEVSELGEVRSKDMWVDNGNGGYTKKGRVLRPGVGGTGYRTVSLRGKTYKVARLVAYAFLDRPAGASVINHIDGNKLNDIAWNLEWVTQAENNDHALRCGLRNMQRIFNWEDRAAVLTDINSMRLVDVADKWNVSPSAIKGIKKNYGDLFSYFEYELADIVIRMADLCGSLEHSDVAQMFKIIHTSTVDKERLFSGTEDTASWSVMDLARIPAPENVGEAILGIVECVVHAASQWSPYPLHNIAIAMARTASIAKANGIDLDRHIELKLAYNETRPRLHGKAY